MGHNFKRQEFGYFCSICGKPEKDHHAKITPPVVYRCEDCGAPTDGHKYCQGCQPDHQ